MLKYSPETEDFFRPRPKAEDEKNPRSRGYILAYSLTIPHIYNIYTTLFTASSVNLVQIIKWSILKTLKLMMLLLSVNLSASCQTQNCPPDGRER